MNLKIDLKSLLKRKPKGEGAESHDGGGASNDALKNAAIWVKAHFLLVAMGTGSLAALAAGTYFSTELLSGLEAEAAQYGGKLSELGALERTPVTITVPNDPPVTVTANAVVNRKLVEAVKSRMGVAAVDPAKISEKAIAHNRGSHGSLANLRREPNDPRRQEVHLDFVKAIVEAYSDLLTRKLGAGLPPAEEDVMLKLQRRQVRFVQSDLKKAPDAALTDSERAQLVAELAAYRVALYAEAADGLRIYAAPEDIGAVTNAFDPSTIKLDMVGMWDRQATYWVVEDVLLACSSLNTQPSVRQNPVKRILKLQWLGQVTAVAAADGLNAGDPPPAGSADAQAGGEPINPAQAVSVSNFGASLKGWATNQMYDVFRCRVSMVVETGAIPRVADALGRQNFIAITDVEITPTDAFTGLQDGCFYGEEPVSTVAFTLESAWLREWTGPLMPDEVRARLKTTGQLAGASSPDAGATKEN